MYTGKTLFAQLMDFLPWTTFARIVDRYGGNRRVRTLACAEHFRILAFAQLTYRESLRDIEACLAAQSGKLYHMGIRSTVRRSTLADANERRDWRIYADFAQRLIAQARKLYRQEDLGLDLSNTVYALDSTTIDLYLSLFPWASFRSAKAAAKMHTLLDLRGNPSLFRCSPLSEQESAGPLQPSVDPVERGLAGINAANRLPCGASRFSVHPDGATGTPGSGWAAVEQSQIR